MPSQLLQLNPAEFIFASFADRDISDQLPRMFELDGAGLPGVAEVRQVWANLQLRWDVPGRGHAGATFVTGPFAVDTSAFDRFVAAMEVTSDITFTLETEVDGTWHALTDGVRGDDGRMELDLPLPAGGQTLTAVRLRLTKHTSGQALVKLVWFAVADSVRRDLLLEPKWTPDPAWPGLLVSAEDVGVPERFGRGLLFDADQLPALRVKADQPGWRPHMDMLRRRARVALERAPEADVGDFVPWTDYRYLRDRERGRRSLWWDALDLGFVGLIDEDPAMLRHAGRFLMSLLHCRHWCQSAESRVLGSVWDSRCFLEEMSASTAAILLDWLDPLLTDRAKRLAHVALWDKGLAVIERDMMKYAYVYRINQGPWFCRARVLAGLMLEDAWPRVGSYVERAMDDLLEGLNHYVLPDGGLDEGVGYFMMTMHTALPAVLAYAKARGRNARDLLPPQLAKSDRYLRIMSAVRPGRFLPEADNSTDRVLSDGVGVLAGLYPEASAYRDILAECLGHEDPESYFSQYMQQGMYSLIHGPDEVPPPRTIVPGFAELPGLGQLTSYREHDDRSTRVHLVGCRANPSHHTHRDKGNLLLELDGVPVLIDRGVPRYDDARKAAFEPAAVHNLLTPWTPGRGFLDQAHPKATMPFTGQSEGDALHAEIDLTPAWAEGFAACSRSVVSLDPDRLEVTDAGRMATPGHAVFHLHARAPFVIDEDARSATLTVEGVTLRIAVPWAERLEQREHLTDFALRPVYHLEAWSPALTADDTFRLTTNLLRL